MVWLLPLQRSVDSVQYEGNETGVSKFVLLQQDPRLYQEQIPQQLRQYSEII